MTKNINKIWVEAIPLKQFIYDEYGEEIQAEIEDSISLYPSPFKDKGSTDIIASTQNTILALARMSGETTARKRAFEKIRDDLISHRLLIVGLEEVETDNPPVLIEANFWFRAEVSSCLNYAETKVAKYRELKVFEETSLLTQLPSSIAADQTLKVVPAPKKLRPNAISSCYKARLIDFDEQNLATRIKIYFNWIKENYPTCDLGQRGFSDNSFEADETNFKKNNRLIDP